MLYEYDVENKTSFVIFWIYS